MLPRISAHSSYHLVGVGGVGMSALAQLLLAHGHKVSGSDRYHDKGQDLPVLAKLRRAGLILTPQDGSALAPETAAVIVSTAIEPDNSDLIAAQNYKIPIVHRAEMLAQMAHAATVIAVAGTAGKTTVTGMLGYVLECLGQDPTVINGGAVLNWLNADNIGNARIGRGPIWVLEVDESDRSLLRFKPEWAIITNVSKDHFELDELERLFRQFAGQVRRALLGCYGELPFSLEEFKPSLSAQGCRFDYRGVSFCTSLLGRHNAENALHCVLMCERLGLSLPEVSRALQTFQGIQRRLQWVGCAAGVTVIDDYAHNPLKIKAAWCALAPYFNRLLAVWRPHGHAPLALMMEELIQAFGAIIGAGDHLLVLPAYYAGGTARQGSDYRHLVKRLVDAGRCAEAVDGYTQLQSRLLELAQPGTAVLLMGARDPFLPVFAHRLLLELDHFVVKRPPGAG